MMKDIIKEAMGLSLIEMQDKYEMLKMIKCIFNKATFNCEKQVAIINFNLLKEDEVNLIKRNRDILSEAIQDCIQIDAVELTDSKLIVRFKF